MQNKRVFAKGNIWEILFAWGRRCARCPITNSRLTVALFSRAHGWFGSCFAAAWRSPDGMVCKDKELATRALPFL